MKRYRSSIPAGAAERVVETHPGGARKKSEYLLAGEVVGVRIFHATGEPAFEYGLRGGRRHGVEYRWDDPGVLLSAEPWRHGVPHGTARQWADGKRLVGTYTLVRGTGIDLWWQQRLDGRDHLAEAIHLRGGRPDGFEWWINEDQRTVYIERHWRDGWLYGIEREWNEHGRLRRGFPRYHVNGQQVTKRRYLTARRSDPALPPFRARDNAPRRTFPPAVAAALRSPPLPSRRK